MVRVVVADLLKKWLNRLNKEHAGEQSVEMKLLPDPYLKTNYCKHHEERNIGDN